MSSRTFKNNDYDRLVWDEIWAAACNNADQENWSTTARLSDLAAKMDIADATLWRCIGGEEIKWRNSTREKMYKQAGYSSIEDFERKLGKMDTSVDTPAEKINLVETVPQKKSQSGSFIPMPPDYFIGRTEMLDKIHQKLTDASGQINILLLNGIGGMGKTTLMQQYLHTSSCKEYFDNIVAISVNRNLESAFITGADEALNVGVREIILREKKLKAVINAMKRCEGQNLFVIDNINEYDFEDLLTMKSTFNATHWKFLITTRTAPDDFEKLQIDELSSDDAILLFAYHFAPDNVDRRNSESLKKFVTDKKLQKDIGLLIEHYDRHTLFTELLAKTGKKKGISVVQLLEILREQELKDKRLERIIAIGRHADQEAKQELRQATLYCYMSNLFDTDYLVKITGNKAQDIENREKATMLQFFSVLPSEDIPVEDLKKLWAVSPQVENSFEDRLDELKQIGWLQGKQEDRTGYTQNIAFSMHPLVQDIVYDKLKPTVESCRPLVITLSAVLPQLKSYPQRFQNYAKSVVDKLNFLESSGPKK